tara:strand:- start:1876 stop:3186 length:1311 start_codon:yes stop_codon:yes gene_type:complete
MQPISFKNLNLETNPMMNAISNNLLSSVSVNKKHITDNPYLFNHLIKPALPITDQKSSGRCWLFATMNLLRVTAYQNFETKFNVEIKNLEFSQSYIFFWDKFHRYQMNLNYYLEILQEKNSSEYLRTFFNDPMGDGGQWDMAKAIVKHYGVVPKEVFPDSFHAKNTRGMNYILTNQLKNDCIELKNVSPVSRNELLKSMMQRVFNMLVSFLGNPPKPDELFSWTFNSKDKVITWDNLTPKTLLDRTSFNPDEFVSVVNDPRPENPFMQKYVIKYLGNLEKRSVGWINLSIDRLKELSKKSIKDNVPVWFGCDVGNNWDKSSGVHHPGIQDFKNVIGLNTTILDKSNRLNTFSSLPNHAMVINGLFEKDGVTKRWKIENSWGCKSGEKGHLLMTDKWFDEFVFQIVIKKDFLSLEERNIINSEPRLIEPWDPLGTLA